MKHAARNVVSGLCSLVLVAVLFSQAPAVDSIGADELGVRSGVTAPPAVLDTTRATAPSGEMPQTFGLHQNYPNPFNPTTSIKYDVAAQSHVRLVVYNMLGKQVATLVDRSHAPGTYQVSFDASHLTSGVYILSMKAADNFHAVRRMVLSK